MSTTKKTAGRQPNDTDHSNQTSPAPSASRQRKKTDYPNQTSPVPDPQPIFSRRPGVSRHAFPP
ncbi:hypothetical protein, partial [Amycolatopsis thermoflava]|uniref:hypothetical protein n=1 Tax=Amycolatopsis thermoflava TaxID=84480 RepID=UPI003EC0E76C